jgi:hypothetical protein
VLWLDDFPECIGFVLIDYSGELIPRISIGSVMSRGVLRVVADYQQVRSAALQQIHRATQIACAQNEISRGFQRPLEMTLQITGSAREAGL